MDELKIVEEGVPKTTGKLMQVGSYHVERGLGSWISHTSALASEPQPIHNAWLASCSHCQSLLVKQTDLVLVVAVVILC